MEEQKIRKVGGWGTEETGKDENNSKECINEIYQYLMVHHPIKGYTYRVYESIPERMYYERDCADNLSEYTSNNKVEPDIPAIFLQSNSNPKDFYLIISGDDKFQGKDDKKKDGNAIERSMKNHRGVFEEKVCFNVDICPYVIFCCGKSFIDENGEYRGHYMAKFRQMFPYLRHGKAHVWSPDDKHSSFKNEWNRIYFKRERFTKEEKFKILKDVALNSVEYYKSFLGK